MRNLFLLLLMANLVFAMWWLWIGPKDSGAEVVSARPLTGPRLVLLSEVTDILEGGSEVREVPGLALAAPGPIAAGQDTVASLAQTSSDLIAADQGAGRGDEQASDEPQPRRIETPDSPETSVALDKPPAVPIVSPGPPLPAPAPSSDSPDASLALATPVVEQRCVSLGPFLDLREATIAAARLRSNALEPRQRLAESAVWMGFWVHLPAYESRAAAVAAVEDLKTRGVSDIYIEPAGELRNAVSLGVYSDRARAQAHADRVRELGVAPGVSERYRQDQVYWIDLDLAPGQSLDPAGYTSTASQSVRLEDRACSE